MTYDDVLVKVLEHKVRYYETVFQMLSKNQFPIIDLEDVSVLARCILDVADNGTANYYADKIS